MRCYAFSPAHISSQTTVMGCYAFAPILCYTSASSNDVVGVQRMAEVKHKMGAKA